MRGSLVTVSQQGDFGKPRPAVIIQSDHFADHSSATVLLVSSTLVSAPLLRITVNPSIQNGLKAVSQVMVDKAYTFRKEKLSPSFGQLEETIMLEVDRCLAVFMGIAK